MKLHELAKSINDRIEKNGEKTCNLLVVTAKSETTTEKINENTEKEVTTWQKRTVSIPMGESFIYKEESREYFDKVNDIEMYHIFIPPVLISITTLILHYFSNWQWIVNANDAIFLFAFIVTLVITIPIGIAIQKRGERIYKKYNPIQPMTENELKNIIDNNPEIIKLRSEGFE